MNTERENGQHDPLVSATYRELATERTPAHLDDKVLRHAARGRRTRYSLAYAWMRPVAWAATIGLCLALVLELSQVPQAPEPVYMRHDVAPTSPQSVPELDLESAIERKREMMAPAAAEATRQKPVTIDAERSRDDDTVPEGLVSPDTYVRRDAAEQARLRDEPLEEAVLNEAAQAGAVAYDEEPACPAEARATAADWLACIAELELAGDKELADREARLFAAAYPDFDAPARK